MKVLKYEERQLELISQIREYLDELELLCDSKHNPTNEPDYTKLELWVDGGSKGNPGLGYGSYAFGDIAEYKIEFGDNLTNNEAEYLALIEGLNAVHNNGNIARIDLIAKTDSALVANQLMGKWAVKADNIREMFKKAKWWLVQFHTWRIEYVPRRDIELVLGH